LVPAVADGAADLAVAVAASHGAMRTTGMAANLGRNAIERASGWSPQQPFSRVRCITHEAMEAALPLSRGAGLEVGMTLDALLGGFLVTEIECELDPAVVRRGVRGPLQSAS